MTSGMRERVGILKSSRQGKQSSTSDLSLAFILVTGAKIEKILKKKCKSCCMKGSELN